MKESLAKFISTFNKYSQDEIDAIVENTKVESFKKGTIILKEEEVCNKCYFVLSGCVRQYQLVDGEEKTTAFFIEGQSAILYSSYMEKRPSKYFLACVEDSVLTTGTRDQGQELQKKHPKLEYLIHTFMPYDFSKVQEHLSSLVKHSPEDRYLELMQNQPELINRVPLRLLASYIGVTPESFSRIRKRITVKHKSK